MDVGRSHLDATSVSDYALFGGGYYIEGSNSYYLGSATVYNASLVRQTSINIGNPRGYPMAASNADYAVFAGGATSSSATSNEVCYLNKSLTHGNASALTYARQHGSATCIKNRYILIAGGSNAGNSSRYNTVDCYDDNLAKIMSPAVSGLTNSVHALASAAIAKYALLGGGNAGTSMRKIVNVYDDSLTKLSDLTLQATCAELAATTVADAFALFGGGKTSNSTTTYSNYVTAFDASLVMSTPHNLGTALMRLGACSTKRFALFGGGERYVSGTYYSDSVYAYEVS